MKLSIIKKMALLLVGLATVQGYAAEKDFYHDPKGRSAFEIYSALEATNGERDYYGKPFMTGYSCGGTDNDYRFIRYTDLGAEPVFYAKVLSSLSYDEKRKVLSFVDKKTFVKPVKRLYGLAVFGADNKTSFYKQENYVYGLFFYDWAPDPSGNWYCHNYDNSYYFADKYELSYVYAGEPYILDYGYMDDEDGECQSRRSLACQGKSTLISDRFVFVKETAGNETVELDMSGIIEAVSSYGYSNVVVAFRRIEYDDPLVGEYVSYNEEETAKNTTQLNIVTYQHNIKIPVPTLRTITFLDYNGNEMVSKSVAVGDVPEAPSLKAKGDTEDFHYFVKWVPELAPVTENATYKAVLDSARKDFNVYLTTDYKAGGDISLSVENKTSCVSITNTYLDGFSYSSNSAVKLTGGAHTLRFDITLNTNGDCANDELAKTIKWTCADESELHFDGCTAIPVYVNGVKNERMLLSEHNDGVYNNGFEYEFDVEVADEKLPTIQLAATYAVGGDVELVSTNAASCVTITKRYLNANCDSYDEDGLCLAGEMLYKYSKGSWMLDQGPQDWPIGAGDVNLKVDKSYQLEYGLNFKPANCTEKEFVESLALVSDKTNLPIYINGSLIGTVLTYSPYFNFTLKSQYTITFFDDKGVQVGDVVTVASGMAVSAPAEPAKREGYTFAGWFQKDAETAYDFSAAVNEDLELYGKWTVNKYEIAVAANDSKMGSVKGAGTYEYGTEVELVATAAEGYKFSNWEDDVKASATRKVKVTAAASYKANFEKIAESSSSEAATNSSSSRNDTESSSSSAKEDKSSSSTKPKSSSSSTKPKSSSSKTDAVVAAAAVPQFSLSVAGRNVQIAGARVGSAYAVLDMQGRVLATGRTASASMEIAVPRAGSYMVRVGSQTKRVNVK